MGDVKKSDAASETPQRLGLVGILVSNAAPDRDRVARVLAEYGSIVIGQAELPCSERDRTLTCVTIKATTNDLGAFTGKLGLVNGVRVKSILL